MDKKLKLFLGTFLMVILLAVPVQASTKSKALKAYQSYLSGQSNSTSFAVIYLDNNNTPELVCGNKLFIYKNGGMKELTLDRNYPTAYYKKKGVIVGTYGHGNIYELYTADYYYKLKGSSLDTFLLLEEITSRGGKPNRYYNSYTKSEYKKLTKAQFNSKLKKVVGSRKKTKIKMVLNTEANRKKVLGK